MEGTYRGLYLACHMKGAAALPTQYEMSMIAFTVTRFVWPDVTLESHERERTKPVVPTPDESKLVSSEKTEANARDTHQ